MGVERSSALPGDKALIRNSSGRANYRYRAPAIAIGPFMHGPTDMRIHAGEHRLFRSIREEEDEDEEAARSVSPMIASFTGESCKAPYARASSQPAASHRNETWDDDVTTTTTSSAPIAAPHEPSNCVKSIISHISDDSCSTRKQSLPLKPSLNSDASSKCRVAKHVHFTFTDKEMSYEVTSDDIENSWLDIDVSRAIEALENGSHDAIVSFGPTGRFTSSDLDVCKNGKEYMVRIQKRRLINEMLGQRTNLRQSVFEEQARQKRNGVVDAEELHAVASEQSKWGVEIAKSSWWLCQT